MGDDLYIAREFSNAALADISAINSMEHRHSTQNIAQIQLKLAQLQNGAKRSRARAIYQSAQIAIDALNSNNIIDPKASDNFDIRLNALSHLITQYEQGLSEVEAAQSLMADTGVQNIPISGRAQPSQMPNIQNQNRAADMDIHALHLTAKTTLTNLMPLAQLHEVPSLQALIDYNYAPEITSEIAPEIARQTPSITTSENSPKRAIKPKQTISQTLKTPPADAPNIFVPLEYVLRDAIQDALSIARISGKTISVSYDVGQKNIENTYIAVIENRLCQALRALVLQSLPQDDIGHIDINLRGDDVIIHSKYRQPSLLPHGLICRKTPAGCEINIPLNVKPKLPVTALPAKTAKTSETPNRDNDSDALPAGKSPMITQAAEAQLRAQLGALLDGPNNADPNPIDENNSRTHEALHMDDNILS